MRRSIKVVLPFLGLIWTASGTAVAARGELPDFSKLVVANGPAVVNISTTRKVVQRQRQRPQGVPEDSPLDELFRRFFRDQPERNVRSLGSGFVISSDGYVVTAAHVIDGASEIVVRLTSREEYRATVVGSDARSDVALLKIDAKNLPTLKIGDPGKLNVGEWVLAIGSPFGFDNTATAGIVSAKGRNLPRESYVPFIQTDAAINPGNSGGPLFNLAGEVVGVNAQIYSRTGGFMGLSFAVPIDLAMSVVTQLKETGRVRRGWLGVTIQNVTQRLADSFGMDRPHGAAVSEILPDSPAAASDLQVGDVIVDFEGRGIERSGDLPPMVGQTPVGETVVLTVLRQGKKMKIEIKIGQLPEQDPRAMPAGLTSPQQEGDLLGMGLRDLDDAQRKRLGVSGGVLVMRVEDGASRDADIQGGDIILRFNGQPVKDIAQLRSRVAGLKPGTDVPVLVRRDPASGGGSLFLALKIPDA